jgi:putative transposase
VGSEYVWLWVAIDLKNRQILALSISKEKNIFVAERFIFGLVKVYGKHSISTDGERTWYPPRACRFLKLKHHLHSALEKSLIEQTIPYLKDRTECFDDYFPCRIENCKLGHVKNWLKMFLLIIITRKLQCLNEQSQPFHMSLKKSISIEYLFLVYL